MYLESKNVRAAEKIILGVIRRAQVLEKEKDLRYSEGQDGEVERLYDEIDAVVDRLCAMETILNVLGFAVLKDSESPSGPYERVKIVPRNW